MKPKIIRTESDYLDAMERIRQLMDAHLNSPEGEELELLALLVESWEDKKCLSYLPDPIEAIKFRMDQEGLKQKDLKPYIGSLSKVSEVLNKKRSLSLRMIRSLSKGLGIPIHVLVQEPQGK